VYPANLLGDEEFTNIQNSGIASHTDLVGGDVLKQPLRDRLAELAAGSGDDDHTALR